MRHVLVIGGSGMLAGLSRRLLEISDAVSVVARGTARLRAVSPAIRPIACDYTDPAAAGRVLAALPETDLAVAWIHGKRPELRRRVARVLAPGGRFVQVLGSAHGDPSHPDRLAEMADSVAGLPIAHTAVVLGSVLAHGHARWLTHDEISHGVYDAVLGGDALRIVGTVEPWSMRPRGGEFR